MIIAEIPEKEGWLEVYGTSKDRGTWGYCYKEQDDELKIWIALDQWIIGIKKNNTINTFFYADAIRSK